MIEKHFYADADTPFHVWVRERSEAHGYRWVLRHASQVIQGETSQWGDVLHRRAHRSDTA